MRDRGGTLSRRTGEGAGSWQRFAFAEQVLQQPRHIAVEWGDRFMVVCRTFQLAATPRGI